MKKKNTGFTLIELMIAVAIVGILSMIAYPSYQQHIRRTAIGNAELSLNGLAQALERHRAQTGSYYVENITEIFRDQSPADGPAQFNLVINNPTATGYSIRAESVGSPAPANCILQSDALGNTSKSAGCD